MQNRSLAKTLPAYLNIQTVMIAQQIEQRKAEIDAGKLDVTAFADAKPISPTQHVAIGTPKANPFSPPSHATNVTVAGVGTDWSCDGVDATKAAVSAVHDAVARLNAVHGSQHCLIHLRLEAPISGKNQQVMCIKRSSLRQALPPNILLLPVDVERGGLQIPQGSATACIVVAFVTLMQQEQIGFAHDLRFSSPHACSANNAQDAPATLPATAWASDLGCHGTAAVVAATCCTQLSLPTARNITRQERL